MQAYTALRGRGNIRLVDFLREQAIELEDIYRGSGRSGWTNLKRDAGLLSTPAGKEDEYFGRRFADLLHFDDPERVDLLLKVGEASAIYKPKNEQDRPRETEIDDVAQDLAADRVALAGRADDRDRVRTEDRVDRNGRSAASAGLI